NPGNESHSGLPPDMPPSPQAYPSLLASFLGFVPILRADSCSLSGDLLTISGAPASSDNAHPTYADCNSSVRHPAVVPDEMAAANLDVDPPTWVTIDAGADDINFGACLEWDLTNVLGTRCTRAGNVTADLVSRLAHMTVALTSAIAQIKSAAPHARV